MNFLLYCQKKCFFKSRTVIYQLKPEKCPSRFDNLNISVLLHLIIIISVSPYYRVFLVGKLSQSTLIIPISYLLTLSLFILHQQQEICLR